MSPTVFFFVFEFYLTPKKNTHIFKIHAHILYIQQKGVFTTSFYDLLPTSIAWRGNLTHFEDMSSVFLFYFLLFVVVHVF